MIAEQPRCVEKATELTQELANLLFSTNVCVLILDSDGCILNITKPMQALTHLQLQSIGQKLANFVADEFVSELYRLREAVLEGLRLGAEVESRRDVLHNGSLYSIEAFEYVKSNESEPHQPKYHAGMVLTANVNELAIANMSAERLARDLRSLIDTASVPIFGISQEGLVNEWNAATAEGEGEGSGVKGQGQHAGGMSYTQTPTIM